MENTFIHSGDLGDIIFALPTIRALGGGHLRLAKRWQVRQVMDEENFNRIASLLRQQPYLFSVELYHAHEPFTHDLDRFRVYWQRNPVWGTSIAEYHAAAFGVEVDLSQPWLEVDPAPVAEGPHVIINRTFRYHNRYFPWKEVMKHYGKRAVFIGHKEEHRAFTEEFGDIPHFETPTLLEAAQAIAACNLYIGNQSCPCAIAEALKVNLIQETYLGDPTSVMHRTNAQYVPGKRIVWWPLPKPVETA